jgi:hypothetical protein
MSRGTVCDFACCVRDGQMNEWSVACTDSNTVAIVWPVSVGFHYCCRQAVRRMMN